MGKKISDGCYPVPIKLDKYTAAKNKSKKKKQPEVSEEEESEEEEGITLSE